MPGMAMLADIESYQFLLFICFSVVLGTAIYIYRYPSASTNSAKDVIAHDEMSKPDPHTSISPLLDFDWKTKQPIALRPFKPKYHLTMALENLQLDELVEVDDTYETRASLRQQILAEHPSTHGSRAGSEAAVYEFYEWMTTIYLPQRFPTMYTLETAEDGEKEAYLYNKVLGQRYPLHPKSADEALVSLGSHVDTDFLFLLPSPDDGKYRLEAFVACFPSGFSTLEKLGRTLAAIHEPVPGYATKLEKSMDRFFANIAVGKVVKRANWSVTTDDKLYAESGNHLYRDQPVEHVDCKGTDENKAAGKNSKTLEMHSTRLADEIARQTAEVKIEECRLRCERQTLHRLPKTQGLVFGFKTYQYTLADVKKEGSGEELAQAIEGLAKGNVPDMAFYKRGVVWGEKVKAFLRN